MNKKPQLVMGLDGHKITRVACGSSHSIAWAESDLPVPVTHEPVIFSVARDPLGASSLTTPPERTAAIATDVPSNETSSKRHRPSLAKIVLSLNTNYERQQSLSHILTALQIMYARDSVVGALMDSKVFLSTESKTSPRDEAVTDKGPLIGLEDITLSVEDKPQDKLVIDGLDEFTGILECEDARLLVELLKLAVASRAGECGKDVLSRVLRALAQGRSEVILLSLLSLTMLLL